MNLLWEGRSIKVYYERGRHRPSGPYVSEKYCMDLNWYIILDLLELTSRRYVISKPVKSSRKKNSVRAKTAAGTFSRNILK
jgi:hypothetical protein